MTNTSSSQKTSDRKSNVTAADNQGQQSQQRLSQNNESREGASLSYPAIYQGGQNSRSVKSSVTIPKAVEDIPNPDWTWAEGMEPRKPSAIAKSERKNMHRYVRKFWQQKENDDTSIGFKQRLKYESNLRQSGQWAK